MEPIKKAALIEALETSGRGRAQRLRELGVPRATYYRWRKRYDRDGSPGLVNAKPPGRGWNKISAEDEALILRHAHEHPELSARLLAVRITDTSRTSVSESTVFRVLKRHGLVTPRPDDEMPASREWKRKTSAPDEIWQCDATTFLIPHRGYYKAIPVLDDYSRKLLALPLMPDETSWSIADAIELGLENARKEGHTIDRMPTLLTDNGPGFAGEVLAGYLKRHGIEHIFGAPYHPQTQGKVERFNRKLRDKVMLGTFTTPEDLAVAFAKIRDEYNATPHEALKNISPNDVYAGQRQKILDERAQKKRLAMLLRRQMNLGRQGVQ